MIRHGPIHRGNGGLLTTRLEGPVPEIDAKPGDVLTYDPVTGEFYLTKRLSHLRPSFLDCAVIVP